MTGESAPAQHFQLALPMYQGPADGLVSLVRAGQVAADDLPLAEVTRQFLAYLLSQPEVDLDLAGAFLTAAGRLVLTKSAHLLAQPTEDHCEESDEPAPYGLARWDCAGAAGGLRTREGSEIFPPGLRPGLPDRPVEPLPATALSRTFLSLRSRRERPVVNVAVPSFVRLETALSNLIRRMKAEAKTSFRRFARHMDRQDTVVYFIGVLELVRRRRIAVSQRGLFEDIVLEWSEPGESRSSRVG